MATGDQNQKGNKSGERHLDGMWWRRFGDFRDCADIRRYYPHIGWAKQLHWIISAWL